MRCWNIYLDEVVIIEEEIGFLQCIRNLAQINGPDTQGGIFVVVEFNFVMKLGFIHVKMNIFRLKCQPPWQLSTSTSTSILSRTEYRYNAQSAINNENYEV